MDGPHLGWQGKAGAGLWMETGLFIAFLSGRGTAETTAFLLFKRDAGNDILKQ